MIFNSIFLSIFELNLSFGQNKTCRGNQGLQLWYLKFFSKTQQICKYKLLNIGDFGKTLKIQLSFVFDCFHLNFSPNSSIKLQNISKEKLLGFKFSKTLL